MTAHRNLIAGEWVAGQEAPNFNPSDTRDVIGVFHQASPQDVQAAIAAARSAFPLWSQFGVQARAECLMRVGREIMDRRNELADLLSREEGKTLREAFDEVGRAGNIFMFFAGEVVRSRGEKRDSVRLGVEVEITREPVGVVSLITPWNFPLAIPAWKIAPALAYGNCVVFKPADLTPASAWTLADILFRAGIPPGVFNLVMGRGTVLGPALVGPGVDAVSFTGSTSVGLSILAAAAERKIAVQLEMGGKNPLVVLDDADLEVAVKAALDGSFFSTGQRCTASSRLIVQEGIHDEFVNCLSAAMKAQVVGDARDPATTIGPVVDARQLQTDLSYVQLGRTEGARLVAGGERPTHDKPGFYLSPTLFVDTTPAMRLNQEEIFGPVAAVIRVKDYDEALNVANDTAFGLCAGICTTSLKYATHFRRNAEVGMVMVNLPTSGVDYHVPFGGRKHSSHGPREQGAYAADFFTALKTSYIKAA